MVTYAARPLSTRCTAAALCASLASLPLPALAAAPATDGTSAKKVEGTVAVLRFGGPPPSGDLKSAVQDALTEAGFSVKAVALDPAAAAKKVKCRGGMDEECLVRLGKWLGKSKKTAADYVIYGNVVSEGTVPRAEVVLFDVAAGKKVAAFESQLAPDDLIAPLILPKVAARALAEHVVPPPPPTEAEQKILATLDEPEKTPEELAAEKERLAKVEAEAGQVGAADVDLSGIEYDLKADFKDFCRNGPRKKRESKDEDIDPRPSCKLGPFWGYWQPRAWAFLTLTAAGAVTTIAMYSVALAMRKPYKDAVAAVEDYENMVGGEASRNPDLACSGDVCYADLALDVTKKAARMRRFAIGGDVALGVTVLFAGVLGIVIHQDRRYAKVKLTEEKRLRVLSDLKVTPAFGRGFAGGMLGFRF